MTDFPDPDVAFVVDAVKSSQGLYDLGAAAEERLGGLTVTAGGVAVGASDASSLVNASSSNPAAFAEAEVSDFVVTYGFYKPVAVSVSANAVALDVSDGICFDVTLTANVSSEGFTLDLSVIPSGKWASGYIRISQDGTGSRTIGGGATVNAGFAAADFDFCGYTIAMPATASKGTVVIWKYFGAGTKTLILPFATPT